MRTNLLQSYMQDKPSRNLDIKYELSNRTFIKPLPPTGHLVNNGILESPSTAAKHVKYDINSLARAVKGKANDHELGKVNDLAMKIGGLAIAGYLMTKKQTLSAKIMEFVGLASFFASMALWPKIALQFPARLIHGFNIRQKYQDSYGREKMFFQDPQYIPVDMIDDKRINKIGDYMKVPKDMPNRREFIEEKMKKVAVQNNTLWMLTAGFATPIMSALICNLAEKPLNRFLDRRTERIADAIPKNFAEEYRKNIDNSYIKNIENLFGEYKNKTLTPELVKRIKETVASGFDHVTARSIALDLDEILKLGNPEYTINERTVKEIVENCKNALAKVLTPEQISQVIPDTENMVEILKPYLNKNLDEEALHQVFTSVARDIKGRAKGLNLSGKLQMQFNGALFNQKFGEGPITSVLRKHPQSVLDESMINELKEASSVLKDFKAGCKTLDKYVYLKLAHSPESNLANAWNDIMESMLDAFKITGKEITETRYDSKLMGKLFRQKLEAISSNDAEYKRVMEILVSKLSQIDERMKGFDMASEESYTNLVDTVFDNAAKKLKSKLPKTARSIVGKFKDDPKNVVEEAGSLKNIYKLYVKNRLTGVRSSLYKIINSLDVFRRISKNQLGSIFNSNVPVEVQEELLEMIKKMAVDGKIADFLTKFYVKRNPNPNLTKGNVVIENGRVVNQFMTKTGKMVDLPNDMTFFQDVMKFLFGEKMHESTKQVTDNTILAKKLREFRQASFEALTNHKYFDKPTHVLSDKDLYTLIDKFNIAGMPLERMAANAGKNRYNTSKWFKMFGGIGAGLLAVTVIAQFFFGKMKGANND